MATYQSLIQARLDANAPLIAVLTGGIYLVEQLVGGKLDRKFTPAAFTTGGGMKPVCLIRGRAETAFSRIKDSETQFRPVRQVLELYLCNDRDTGFAALESAETLIYGLLAQRRVANSWKINYVNRLSFNDPENYDAATVRLEYEVIGHRANN
jgi:hypothetical protein